MSMSVDEEFGAFLATFNLPVSIRIAILNKFIDLQPDIIAENERIEEESRRDGRRDTR
jgi:hypothetical protein